MSEAKEQNNKRSNGKGTEPTRSFDGFVLGPGGQIGPFRIEQELGRGAVGVVYLAHDTKLDRPVAIKSLPAELTENTNVRTRFAREARVLASLNHPNIATIYEELQEAEGVGYLVLEYVPGQTLAERIAGKRLKPQEALPIAQQIAEAVAAAHEHEVIHRDLKPGNIKITPEGRIKVLDFGLAKALGGEALDQQSTVTQPGRVMGTPSYMSPEQARGLETDKRCDIWSFGCVLYEMLTGKVPFKGETVSDTLASILDREPDWHALPQTTPANIRILLRRCLEKDSRRRLHDIADAAIEICETMSGTLETFALPVKVDPVSRLFRRDVILTAFACLIAGVLIAAAIFTDFVRPSPPEPPVVLRLPIKLPADKPLYTGTAPNCFLAISPDSTHLVYVGELDNRDTELYMRSMDDLQIKPIPGTRNAHNPFFSPDGQWVGFFTEKQLKKVSLAGGEPLTLLKNIQWGVAAFGSWADDGTIVFSVRSGNRGLQRIPDNGGQQAEPLIAPVSEDDEVYYCYPQVLPGGNAILYSHVYSHALRTSRIEAFQPEIRKWQVVLDDASYATYVSSGHLIFVRGKVLMAIPFDIEQLKITGPSVPLVNDDVGFDWGGWTPQITVSRNGTIVYISWSESRKGELVWVDRQGVSTPLVGAPSDVYSNPCLSPDGRLIAVEIWSQKEFTSQVHVYNVKRHTLTQLTTEGENRNPQWSPDGKRIAFWSSRTERPGVFWKTVGASAPAEPLVSQPSPEVILLPYSWSHNRNLLACTTVLDPNTQDDIWIVDPNGDEKPKPLFFTEYSEYNPTFSPDGRWLAYVSDESGQPKIYLREYPDAGHQWTVSTLGATNPVWSRDGRELYYICDNSMMAVKVTSEPVFPIEAPKRLFVSSDVIVSRGSLGKNYDVSDDGQFLMVKRSDDVKDQLICVHNWFEELKRLVPPGTNR
ncbi:MAG: serine/threonine-protein kinase [Planctomycetes bacterium]|nr:serine/threonine-protein kinase [Planctomycetota bacterium]